MPMEHVFQAGLHDFVEGFITDNNQLGELVSEQFLF
jgi:hypothetical protein